MPLGHRPIGSGALAQGPLTVLVTAVVVRPSGGARPVRRKNRWANLAVVEQDDRLAATAVVQSPPPAPPAVVTLPPIVARAEIISADDRLKSRAVLSWDDDDREVFAAFEMLLSKILA